MTTLEELLYQTAAHAIEQQERHVAELRARTATLLAAAAISASFLGDDVLAHVHLAARLHATHVGNRALVETLDARFRGASALLVVELVLWIAALTVA